MSGHRMNFDALHRYIQQHLNKADYPELIRRSAVRLEKGKTMPKVWKKTEIDLMRALLIRMEDEL